MTLSFQTQIDGKPNYFIQKIWNGISNHGLTRPFEQANFAIDHFNKFGENWDLKNEYTMLLSHGDKIHTIREDKGDRWKVGNKIHFVINNRQSNRFQFAPVLKVKRIDHIQIEWFCFYRLKYPIITIFGDGYYMRFHDGEPKRRGTTAYDGQGGKKGYFNLLRDLSENDGFDSIEDFLEYFNQDFLGKIIHWTGTKYYDTH